MLKESDRQYYANKNKDSLIREIKIQKAFKLFKNIPSMLLNHITMKIILFLLYKNFRARTYNYVNDILSSIFCI